jgi:hypothetical protein
MECTFCGKTFNTKSSLNRHKKTTLTCLEKRGIDNTASYLCSACSYRSTHKTNLTHHQHTCTQYILKQAEHKYDEKLQDAKRDWAHEYEIEMKLLQKDLVYKQQEIDRLTAQLDETNARYQRLAELKSTGPMKKADRYAYLQPLELPNDSILVFPTHAANLGIDNMDRFVEEFIRTCLTANDGTIQLAVTDRSRGNCLYRKINGKLESVTLEEFGRYFDMGPYFEWAGNTARSSISDPKQHQRLQNICQIYSDNDEGLRNFVKSMTRILVSKALPW